MVVTVEHLTLTSSTDEMFSGTLFLQFGNAFSEVHVTLKANGILNYAEQGLKIYFESRQLFDRWKVYNETREALISMLEQKGIIIVK